ncbi:MAG: dipicolinate synthase subunit DpsA [Gracilibacteraceae bacterium]|jgi:dipicolinate synthase subunit A|nr:dipicolinate synthase subunit DpsA [Gracilibacteraceae bacterium]
MEEHKNERQEQGVLDRMVLAVIGGDDREIYLIPELQKLGAYIIGLGLEESLVADTIECADSFAEIAAKANALLFPMFGTDERGLVKAKFTRQPIILDKEALDIIPRHVPVFIGWARPVLRAAAEKRGLRLIEVANRDEVAIMNSVPSAEGAIQMAMESTAITVHGSVSFVLGFGRFGLTLARTLLGMGARVSVAARKPSDWARAEEMGARAVDLAYLEKEIAKGQIVFNTIPAMVLSRPVLDHMAPDAVIIDLASIPGGTDFEYARKRGVKAMLAPGLPGIVAPKTAGHMLARVYPSILAEYLPNVSWQRSVAIKEGEAC